MGLLKSRAITDGAGEGIWLRPGKWPRYANVVQSLVAALEEISPYTPILTGAAKLAGLLWEPPYHADMVQVAAYSDLSVTQVVLANHAYEISRFGCTTRVDAHRGKLRLCRTLDWPLPGIGEHTATVHHKPYGVTNVTFPGLVGALTGMRAGGYAVAINAAPGSGFSNGWQPLLLVRWVLENCDSYEEALEVLTGTELTTGVFFTLVGTEDACVIERTASDFQIRPYDGTPLVVANHYVHKDFRGLNPKNPDSRARYKAFKESKAGWRKYPVMSETTVQYVEMVPEIAKCDAWGVT